MIELNLMSYLMGLIIVALFGFYIGYIYGSNRYRAELLTLNRFRIASHLAWRWNGQVPNSAETAQWIMEVAENKRPLDIEQFRERLLRGQ